MSTAYMTSPAGNYITGEECYFELTLSSYTDTPVIILGMVDVAGASTASDLGADTASFGWNFSTGNLVVDGSNVASWGTPGDGAVVGVKFKASTKEASGYINGTQVGTTVVLSDLTFTSLTLAVGDTGSYTGEGTVAVNYGQSAFTLADLGTAQSVKDILEAYPDTFSSPYFSLRPPIDNQVYAHKDGQPVVILDPGDSGLPLDFTSDVFAVVNEAFPSASATKLSGIEVGATADQTGAEIKALYEAEADTNAFTDAEKALLASAESGATADQTGAEFVTAVNTALGSTQWQGGGVSPSSFDSGVISSANYTTTSALPPNSFAAVTVEARDSTRSYVFRWGARTVDAAVLPMNPLSATSGSSKVAYHWQSLPSTFKVSGSIGSGFTLQYGQNNSGEFNFNFSAGPASVITRVRWEAISVS